MLWAEYYAARKRGGDLLRLAVKFLNRVLNKAISARVPDEPAPDLNHELYFKPSVPHYPVVGHAWVPSNPDCFAELSKFDASEPWRVWWLTRPVENLYNTCFSPHHPKSLVFVPAGFAQSDVVSRIVEDVDPNEPAPTAVSPAAPIPQNRRDTQIFASSVAQRSNSRPHESVETVTGILFPS